MMIFPPLPIWLIGLQGFHVAFLLLHDWVPLGPFNNLKALGQNLKPWQRIIGPVISAILPGIGLYLSLPYATVAYPPWLGFYLLAAYAFLFLGEIEAWWATYFWGYMRDRAATYQATIARTVTFLPLRNGIAPNAIHVLLHLATVATLGLLSVQIVAPYLKL